MNRGDAWMSLLVNVFSNARCVICDLSGDVAVLQKRFLLIARSLACKHGFYSLSAQCPGWPKRQGCHFGYIGKLILSNLVSRLGGGSEMPL